MKKLIFPSFLIIGCLSLNSFVNNNYEFSLHNQANNFFTGGAPASRTGAPGEANCTACHGGGANDGSLRSRTTIQAGAEIFGDSSMDADAESISLMIESLQSLGIKNLTLSLGHAGLVSLVLAQTMNINQGLLIT